MKETLYFSHDCNARNDSKLQRLQMKLGLAGVGCFWCIIEMLYEENGRISVDECERIAFELRTQCELIKSVINDFNLFVIKDGFFYSKSVLRRLEKRRIKSEKAKKSASARWTKDVDIEVNSEGDKSECNANASDNDANAMLKRKIKEKENNNISLPLARVNVSENLLEVSLQECYNNLLANQSWYECFCMNNHINVEDFKLSLKAFFVKLSNEGEITKTPKDAMSHFSRWYDGMQSTDRKRNKSSSKILIPSNLDKEATLLNKLKS